MAVVGIEQFAARIGFSTLMVRAWMGGRVRPPEDVFFEAIGILHGQDDVRWRDGEKKPLNLPSDAPPEENV